MRSNRDAYALLGSLFALAVISGCGGEPEGQTDLAKLEPPSQEVIDKAKSQARPQTKPRFGSPPRSAANKP